MYVLNVVSQTYSGLTLIRVTTWHDMLATNSRQHKSKPIHHVHFWVTNLSIHRSKFHIRTALCTKYSCLYVHNRFSTESHGDGGDFGPSVSDVFFFFFFPISLIPNGASSEYNTCILDPFFCIL